MTDGFTGRESSLTRRRLLVSGATAGVVTTAGCLGTRDGRVPRPIVTDDRIDDGWRRIDQSESEVFEESFGPVTVRALERTDVYEYVDLAAALAETFDANGSPVIFFASRIDLRPALDGLPGGIGRDRVMEEVHPAARAAFRDQLAESGLSNVELADTDTVDVDSGHTATTDQFTAQFDVEGETLLSDGTTGAIEEVVEVEARLAVWHDGTDVLLSGGAYPTEPIITDELDVEADALSAKPETFAEKIDALLVAVE